MVAKGLTKQQHLERLEDLRLRKEAYRVAMLYKASGTKLDHITWFLEVYTKNGGENV